MVKVEIFIGFFDIVNFSDGVFEDLSRFLSEIYIYIWKVLEFNIDEMFVFFFIG